VFPDGHAPRIIPKADETLLAAARALAEDQPKQEATVRAAAEKWIAGVTALFGLFGLAGIVTAKDAVTGVDLPAKIIASVLLLIAIISAATALFETYRAAYGFPKAVDVADNEQLRQWFTERQKSGEKSANRLRQGVFFALVAVVALIACVGVIRFAPVTPAAPLVKVTLVDHSFVCGELLNTTKNGELRIRLIDGTVRAVNVAQIATSINVVGCPA
jgi:hypothetical protein